SQSLWDKEFFGEHQLTVDRAKCAAICPQRGHIANNLAGQFRVRASNRAGLCRIDSKSVFGGCARLRATIEIFLANTHAFGRRWQSSSRRSQDKAFHPNQREYISASSVGFNHFCEARSIHVRARNDERHAFVFE